MQCPQCKKELRETGLGLFNCPKCHRIYQRIEQKNVLSVLCDKCVGLGESISAPFKITMKEIECQFCKRKIKVK